MFAEIRQVLSSWNDEAVYKAIACLSQIGNSLLFLTGCPQCVKFNQL